MSDIDRVRQVVAMRQAELRKLEINRVNERELSDEKMRDYITRWKNGTQNNIDDQLEAGAVFVITRATKWVHTRECPTIQQRLNVERWWPFSEGFETREIGGHLAGGGYPWMPLLATGPEVNDAGCYTRCRVCAPDVAEKRPRVREIPSTAARNLRRTHIGRTVEGQAVRAILLVSEGVELIFEDGTTLQYAMNDRIYFDPPTKPHQAAES